MRIAQVCPYSLTVPGGVQGQVLGLGRALRKLGHEARVLAPCDGPPPDPMVTPLGKSIPTAVNGSMAPIAPDPACALRTIHTLRNENFDVLHLHEPIVPGPTFTSLMVADIPIVGTFHAAGSRTGYNYWPWGSRRAAKRLRVRVAVSEDARLTAENSIGGHCETLYNGIEIERFRDAMPAPKDGFTMFFVARHEHRKGLSTLLEAMKHVPADVKLWVAGYGPETSQLQEAARHDSRIEWVGRITDLEKAERMKAADVFCAPSLEGESFGIVLLEAMAAGTAVLASDLDGYRNVARDGKDALLVPPGDPLALASGIETLYSDPGIRERLVTSGDERVLGFSMDRLAADYVDLYERCLNNYPFVN